VERETILADSVSGRAAGAAGPGVPPGRGSTDRCKCVYSIHYYS
jgi:hypothetical protein